jgi:hypothetical protein
MKDDHDRTDKEPEETHKPSARERTVKHLKGLLVAAAGATLAAGSCCSGSQTQTDPVVCDPLPPPIEADAGPDEVQPGQGQDQGGGEGGLTITDGGSPPPYQPPPDEPPVVCDPLPPPMED